MTYYFRNGADFLLSSTPAVDMYEKLPVGTYMVNCSMERGYYLSKVDDFALPKRIYGRSTNDADRILRTFQSRPKSTGVLLTGEKGTGKTLLASQICVKAREEGIPTLIVNSPYCDDGFSRMIQSINQPAILFFDEFEKVYDATERQPRLLTLMDGVFSSQKLFLLTSNDKWRVNNHMINRPGRIYYSMTFGGLDQSFIREYCEEILKDKSQIDVIVTFASTFRDFTFDMLKALVEEMNRYDETAQEAIRYLNIDTSASGHDRRTFKSIVLVNGETPHYAYPSQYNGNPLTNHINIEYQAKPRQYDDNDEEIEDPQTETHSMRITPSNLKKIEQNGRNYRFEATDEYGNLITVLLAEEEVDSFNVWGLM